MERFQVTVDAELEPIMDRYFDIRRKEQGELEQAIQSGEADTVRMLGHKLKGTGSSYGFHRLTELGAAIEIAGKSGELAEAAALAAEVRAYIENVEVAYGDKG